MKFDQLLEMIGPHAWFDLATVVQIANEPRKMLLTQLHRWCKSGQLISLRRGMYAFAEKYRRREIRPAELANQLYTPSCLSLQWALGYYGLIPEKAVVFTSVTTRQTKRFSNEFGNFTYRHLKPEAFFGYQSINMDGRNILIATPEKALLDLWYLEKGDWNHDRIAEMRYQNFEVVNPDFMAEIANRLNSARINAAARTFLATAQNEMKGTVEL